MRMTRTLSGGQGEALWLHEHGPVMGHRPGWVLPDCYGVAAVPGDLGKFFVMFAPPLPNPERHQSD